MKCSSPLFLDTEMVLFNKLNVHSFFQTLLPLLYNILDTFAQSTAIERQILIQALFSHVDGGECLFMSFLTSNVAFATS